MAETEPTFKVKKREKPNWKWRLLKLALVLVLSGGVAGLVAVVGAYLYYAPTLPKFDSFYDYQPKVGTRVYSADHQLIGEFSAERRVMVNAEQIPKQLANAFIAAEDKRFRSHFGVDVLGVMQAILDKILHPSSKLRGASTITQQVAKSLLASAENFEAASARKLSRKIKEAILAIRLESLLSKDQIIYMYMSEVFLGHQAYGVQAAAEHYFRKNVWELNLAEIATFAGLPQRPSDYSPRSNPKKAHARRRYVLRRLLADGYITQDEADEAMEVELVTYPRKELYLQVAPYYTEQVRRILVDRYGERAILEDGLRVYTAMHIDKQYFGQVAATRQLRALDRRQGFRGPLAKLETRALRSAFLSSYRNQLKLEDGEELDFEKNKLYVAVVGKVNSTVAEIDVAGRKGFLPLAGMRWARKPNPMVRYDLGVVSDIRKVLRLGDVVTVKISSKAELGKDPMGWSVVDTVPDQGDIFKLEQEPIAQAALISVDPRTGYVVAQVGGYNFEDSSFNRAVQACREPGSAFKPIVYSAAIEDLDYTPSTPVDDKPLIFDDPEAEVRWKPSNAGSEFRGTLPMRTCLMDSINTPAIRIAEAVGMESIVRNARRLGMSTPLKRELGTALGSSCTTLHDLAKVYTSLNQYGERRPLIFVRKVVDRYGNVLEDHTSPWDPSADLSSRLDGAYARLSTPERQAITPQSAFVTVSLMENVVEGGTAVRAKALGVPAAGKTGTTNDSYDAWFMGFTRNLVTGVWVGHDKKERPLGINEQGGRTALPVWVEYMKNALVDHTLSKPAIRNDGGFSPPRGVVRIAIDAETGLLARSGGSAVYEYYRSGTQPVQTAPDPATVNPEEVDLYGAESEL